MKLTRKTTSFCSTCYKEIAANVAVSSSGGVIEKTCPVHGAQSAILERDAAFYTYVTGLTSEIYPGHFVDVTRRCNLRCEYCFYPLKKADPKDLFNVNEILNECEVNRHRLRFHFTGGEPTLHPELGQLIRSAQQISGIGKDGVELLSNGVKLAEPDYYQEIMPLITSDDGLARLNLSIHHKETDRWKAVIEQAKADGIKLQSVLIVIDDEASFNAAVDMAKTMSDCVRQFRIKGASRMWNEMKPAGAGDKESRKVFVSDMLNWLEKRSKPTHYIYPQHNKPMFFNVAHDAMHLALVCWHDVDNVDLREIDMPPTYRARNGEVCNLVTANLINEGMQNGWLKGVKIEPEASVALAMSS